jgi:thioredoxin 1
MAEILSTTDADFSDMVSEPDKLILVDLWAEWCGPCMMMEPVLEEIAEEYSGKLKVVKLNIDQNQETPLKFGVMNIPTLIFFRDGKEVDRVIGAFPKKQLVNKIEPHLQ